MSITPLFNKIIEEYFARIETDEDGGACRICRLSGEKFYLRAADIAFHKSIGTPLPSLCPTERWRRLMSYLNDYNLFHLTSAYSKKKIIAAYPPNTPYKIYEHELWLSDAWDPLDYGRAYNPEKSFFDQFHDLQQDVPRPNLMSSASNILSEYTNTSTNLKNCYLTFDTLSGENLYYFICCAKCEDCVDCMDAWNCKQCYACKGVNDLYDCQFVKHSRSCTSSQFLYDCRKCDSCFMCANLRSKKYCFMNKQLTAEAYEKEMQTVNLGNRSELEKYQAVWKELDAQAIRKANHNLNAANSYGDWIENSKDCYLGAFLWNCENVNYSMGLMKYRDSEGVVGGIKGERCSESILISCENNFNVHFSVQITSCRDVEYCELCSNCVNCIGCIGLRNKSFCILNKQYSEEDYWKVADELKAKMLETKDYGEFFPPALMPVPYRISLATSYPGFDDFENAASYGYDCVAVSNNGEKVTNEYLESKSLPENIQDAKNSIAEKIIHDEENDRYFRLTRFELDFYRTHNLALPHEHPLERLKKMREEGYDLRLSFGDRICGMCGTKFESPCYQKRFPNVYCNDCYTKEVS